MPCLLDKGARQPSANSTAVFAAEHASDAILATPE